MADNTFNEELLIGAFGTLCDFLVDMQLCARDCPYSGNRNEDGECNAWQVIHDMRNKREITDVQPVKRGRWELTDNPSFRKCSKCGAWWSSDITDNCFTNYCPKCGAKMIKEG
jgi:hypothetical protein